MHISAGLIRAGSDARALHPVELLDAAYATDHQADHQADRQADRQAGSR